MWSFKLVSMNVLPAVVFALALSGLAALVIGYISLRRSGIYFSILTLAFAQMSYNLAYSVFTPITNGENGLRVINGDPHWLDAAFGWTPAESLPSPNLFAIKLTGYSRLLCRRRRPDRRLLHLGEDLPFALRHDAEGAEVQPDAPRLHRFQHAALCARRFRRLRHVCRARRLAAGDDRPAGGRRAHAVDGVRRDRSDDHPRRRRHARRPDPRRRHHQVFREHPVDDQRPADRGDVVVPA